MTALGRFSAGLLLMAATGSGGCGGPPAELTSEQIAKQNAEDAAELAAENAIEAEQQKQNRKKR
jgi:hypothetical protein